MGKIHPVRAALALLVAVSVLFFIYIGIEIPEFLQGAFIMGLGFYLAKEVIR